MIAFLLLFAPFWACETAHLTPKEELGNGISSDEKVPKYTLKKLYPLSSFGASPFSSNAQGMDVYDDRILFQTGTNDRTIHIVDLESHTAIGSVVFTTPNGEGAHMNNINCSDKFTSSDLFPLLYVSQTGASHSCFVIRLSNDAKSFETIQTIRYSGKTHYLNNCSYDWFIDPDNKFIYTYGHYNGNRVKREIMKFNLPSLDIAEVTFTDDDILDSFVLENQSIYQGSKMIDGMLYAPVGAGSELYPSRLIIIDLNKKEVAEDIPLHCGEPEAIGRYKSGAIICTGGWDPFYFFITLTE